MLEWLRAGSIRGTKLRFREHRRGASWYCSLQLDIPLHGIARRGPTKEYNSNFMKSSWHGWEQRCSQMEAEDARQSSVWDDAGPF